jgi:MFS family permease
VKTKTIRAALIYAVAGVGGGLVGLFGGALSVNLAHICGQILSDQRFYWAAGIAAVVAIGAAKLLPAKWWLVPPSLFALPMLFPVVLGFWWLDERLRPMVAIAYIALVFLGAWFFRQRKKDDKQG